jgi:hypothetical protein
MQGQYAYGGNPVIAKRSGKKSNSLPTAFTACWSFLDITTTGWFHGWSRIGAARLASRNAATAAMQARENLIVVDDKGDKFRWCGSCVKAESAAIGGCWKWSESRAERGNRTLVYIDVRDGELYSTTRQAK